MIALLYSFNQESWKTSITYLYVDLHYERPLTIRSIRLEIPKSKNSNCILFIVSCTNELFSIALFQYFSSTFYFIFTFILLFFHWKTVVYICLKRTVNFYLRLWEEILKFSDICPMVLPWKNIRRNIETVRTRYVPLFERENVYRSYFLEK